MSIRKEQTHRVKLIWARQEGIFPKKKNLTPSGKKQNE
ncbi:MAG: hypothetical protein XD63_1799, partial [Thermoanaerobacterales bacterium 50_218]